MTSLPPFPVQPASREIPSKEKAGGDISIMSEFYLIDISIIFQRHFSFLYLNVISIIHLHGVFTISQSS